MSTPPTRVEPPYLGPTRPFAERMLGAALLDPEVFEEVEADAGATAQAATVVGLAAASAAFAQAEFGLAGVASGVVGQLAGWSVWALITYVIGDKLLGGVATWGQLLRTLGFAQAPGILMVLTTIPGMAWLRWLIGAWLLLAGLMAIRQALDVGTARAVVTAVLGFAAFVGTALLLAAALGIPLTGLVRP
jgi:hypothetical protein